MPVQCLVSFLNTLCDIWLVFLVKRDKHNFLIRAREVKRDYSLRSYSANLLLMTVWPAVMQKHKGFNVLYTLNIRRQLTSLEETFICAETGESICLPSVCSCPAGGSVSIFVMVWSHMTTYDIKFLHIKLTQRHKQCSFTTGSAVSATTRWQ